MKNQPSNWFIEPFSGSYRATNRVTGQIITGALSLINSTISGLDIPETLVTNTFEQTAGGFDPSIGRTPVELSNNYDTAALAISTNRVVKASPGYLHKIILAAGKAYDMEIHDNATTNSGLVFDTGAIPASNVPIVIEINALMTAGITIRNTHASVAHVAGDVVILYR
jgi:hypothetical protein